MDFEQLTHRLKESSNFLTNECYELTRNIELKYRLGIKKDKEELTSLYEFRLKLAKEYRSNYFDQKEFDSWEKAIIDLKNDDSKVLGLSTISTKEKSYLIFWNHETEKIITIIRLNSKNLETER